MVRHDVGAKLCGAMLSNRKQPHLWLLWTPRGSWELLKVHVSHRMPHGESVFNLAEGYWKGISRVFQGYRLFCESVLNQWEGYFKGISRVFQGYRSTRPRW